MNTLKQIITQVSERFIQEALSSPRMLEDLAAMEKYMSESYDGRTFIELMQNADDARSGRIKAFNVENTLIVANDGRPFDETDIMAICRSGASKKQRGSSIGYRGVGFKSATSISTEIIIYSSDVYFTFSKNLCAKTLGREEDCVPTVRIPFLYDANKLGMNMQREIEKCKSDGYSTFFIFRNADINRFVKEIEGVDAGWLIFLKNLACVEIDCGIIKKKCIVSRKHISESDQVLKVIGSREQWYLISKNGVSLGFKFDSAIGVLPSSAEEGVFHCFLPTLDKTGFPFKANADFSTDPSRKHIIQDQITVVALEKIEKLFTEVIDRIIHKRNEAFYPVLSLLNNYTTLNPLVTGFEAGILNNLRDIPWVPINNGQYVTPPNANVFPKWLNSDEKQQLAETVEFLSSHAVRSEILEKTEKLEVLLGKLGTKEISMKEFGDLLTDANYANRINPAIWGKIFVYCIRVRILDAAWIGKIFVPTMNSCIQLSDASAETALDPEFVEASKNILNTKEVETLSLQFDVFSLFQNRRFSRGRINKKSVNERSGAKNLKLAINKWKTPVQNCMAVENICGNSVKDTSKKSDEYDVISTDTTGNVSYIAVKTVGVLGDSFRLSENEFSAAQRLGAKYKVYLFTTNTNDIEYMVITNPVDSVVLKKVVKEWEWICESYQSNNENPNPEERPVAYESGDSIFQVDFDSMDGKQFEKFCARLLIKNGYEDVSRTKGSGDQGIDIIAFKDNIKYGIQCKCYSSDIGNSAVQEVFAGKAFYKCNIGIVLTNRHFSPSAIELAKTNGIILWGREALLKLIRNIREY